MTMVPKISQNIDVILIEIAQSEVGQLYVRIVQCKYRLDTLHKYNYVTIIRSGSNENLFSKHNSHNQYTINA